MEIIAIESPKNELESLTAGFHASAKGENMNTDIDNKEWSLLSYKEKNRSLFHRQKGILDMLLERGAISKEQYDKSLHDLIDKMSVVVDEE